jgi:hypothetical protein
MIKDRCFYFDKVDGECDLASFRLNEEAADKPVTSMAAEFHKGRPDLLGLQLFGDWELWWAVLRLNGIEDPFNDIERGTLLETPEKWQIADYVKDSNA